MGGVRLQNVTPEMEQVFEQIHSYFHAREATAVPAQPPPLQPKNNQRKKPVGTLGSGVSAAPPRCQLTSAAAVPPTKPAAQKSKGNKPRVETAHLEDPLNCAELKNTLTPKKDLLSALQNLSSDDWYAPDSTTIITSSVFMHKCRLKKAPNLRSHV